MANHVVLEIVTGFENTKANLTNRLRLPRNQLIILQLQSKEPYFSRCIYLQLWTFAIIRLLNKPYENEVTLTGQNAPLKCCKLLGLLTQLKKEIDL